MAVVSENRPLAPGGVSKAGASVRVFALRIAPVALALAAEPWTGAAIALDLFRRKPQAQRQRHVVNASIILLGLAAIIIATLAITSENARTWSDEIAWIAAGFMLGSIALSHSATRGGIARPLELRMADGAFLAGMAAILLSLVAAAWQLPR